jgi:hypothetical protein
MAIDKTYLSLVKSVLDQRDPATVGSNMTRAVCLSYPDLLVSEKDLVELFGDGIVSNLEIRKDDQMVRRLHSLPDNFGNIFLIESLFEQLQVQFDFIDIKKLQGPEEIVDLNEPLPPKYIESYGLVIDTGTLEHCFKVGTAFRSMCEMTAHGGVVISNAPLSLVNHGFWNFCPTAYFDCFDQNGFTLQFLQAVYKNADEVKMFDMLSTSTERRRISPEASVMCIAQRTSIQQFKWPVQTKYKAMLSAKF